MATVENDFEKGEANGNKALVDLIGRVTQTWREKGLGTGLTNIDNRLQ